MGFILDRSENKMTIRCASSAVEEAQSKGNLEDICSALIQLAHLHFRQGRYAQTQKLAKEVLLKAPEDSPHCCDALRMLGNCAAELGDPDQAEAYYHNAIDLARQVEYR